VAYVQGGPNNRVVVVSSPTTGAAVTALADPTVSTLLTDLGFEIYSRDQQTPKALAAYQKAEIEKWWPIIKEFGIKAE
jgi:tripartite-type tricarboxylate transporter receptor subunit TctC